MRKQRKYQHIAKLLADVHTMTEDKEHMMAFAVLATYVHGCVDRVTDGAVVKLLSHSSSAECLHFAVDTIDTGLQRVTVKPSLQHTLVMKTTGPQKHSNYLKGIVHKILMEFA